MRVGIGRLTLWSFLMVPHTARAHGRARIPRLSASSAPMAYHHMGSMLQTGASMISPSSTSDETVAPDTTTSSSTTGVPVALLATGLHALGYLLMTAFVALLVYEKLGPELLCSPLPYRHRSDRCSCVVVMLPAQQSVIGMRELR